MAMASWMFRGRSLRSGRPLRSRHDSEDDVQLDLTKDAAGNARDILLHLCKKQGVTEGKRFGYLNAFVKLLSKSDPKAGDLGYTVEQLLCCLRVALVHDASQVRAAALRAVRYLLKEENDAKVFHNLHYSYLVTRSLDVNLHNDAERMQALRLIRRILVISPLSFPPGLVRSLVALANGAGEEKDRMLRVCLAALSEICVLNTDVFITCGGVTAVQRNLMDCSMPRIAESLCGVLLFLLNTPTTRLKAAVRLHALAAPFCDFHWDASRNRDEREVKFHCSRLALLSVLRSWSGVLHFCHPGNGSGLRALVDILYVRQLEVRKSVLDLLYELLGLPQPEWTDEFSVALDAVDPSYPRDSWRLSEGFVAAEGRAILPHLAKCRPNLVEMHLALLLYTFLEVGLLEAVAEVVVTADTFISVRATVLLGELLHLIHLLLPPECCNLTPALPTLLAKAASHTDPAAQNQALAAVAALVRLHTMLKKQPAPSSVFLDQILQGGAWGVQARTGGLAAAVAIDSKALAAGSTGRSKRERSKLYQLMLKDSHDIIRESMVLSNKDGFSWNWNVVRAILKTRNEALRKLEDSDYKTFLRRLVQYYKPSSNRFSRVEFSSRRQMNIYTLAGFELLDCLLEAEEPEGQKMLSELLTDIWVQVDAITSSRSAHDCLFSPQHVANSLCQDYFLFIGRLCRTARGIRSLEKAGILQQLMNLVVATNHEGYVKLVVAGLDYTLDAMPRVILSKVLTAGVEASRLYATQHMLVLLRAKLPDFHKWGIELLVMQLYDPSRTVSSAALSILTEAVEDESCLDIMVNLQPALLHLGDRGLLLLIRFLSTTTGFTFLQDAGFVATQMERWGSSFNCRYVHLVEGELHDSLTLHQRGEDGRYSQRITSARHYVKDVLVPPHLYGQLAQHESGMTVLKQDPQIPKLLQVVLEGVCEKEADVLKLKAALWAVGHIGTSEAGVNLLNQADAISAVVRLAESCLVYTVRATAFYAVGLLATTPMGTSALHKLGWLSVRHNRHDQWPVIEEQPDNLDDKPPANLETDDALSLLSGIGQNGDPWDIDSGDNLEGHSFYLQGDEESGNEDEGMLLDEMWPSPGCPGSSSGTGFVMPGAFKNQQTKAPSQRKSATLPHWRPGVAPPRHIRSLSESKQPPPQVTVGSESSLGGDWAPGNFNRMRQRDPPVCVATGPAGNSLTPVVGRSDESKSRSNSCTDSSGVSSCDSGPGRHPINERVTPALSPIPSSASLQTLRRISQTSHRKLSASTHGSVTSEGTHSSPSDITLAAASSLSRLSQQDLLGYATLRSIHRHRRPLLSDSGSGKSEDFFSFEDCFPLSVSVTGPAASPASARALKARSLDRHFSHPSRLCEFDGTSAQIPDGRNSAPLQVQKDSGNQSLPAQPTGVKSNNEQSGPCYLGICLPRHIMVLFPSESQSQVSFPSRRRGSTSFSELEQLPEAGQEVDPSSSSSESDDSDGTKPIISGDQGLRKDGRSHNTAACLVCCSRNERNRRISADSFHRHRTDTESSQGMESPVLCPPQHREYQSGAEALGGNTPNGSADSANSFGLSGHRAEATAPAPSWRLLRRDVLKHIGRMSNPVWAKLSKQALLQLKQKYPAIFQDVCLYSAVCQRMASSSYRLVARRFIQELFLDLNFDTFYEEGLDIVQNQQLPTSVQSSKGDVQSSSFATSSPKLCAKLVPSSSQTTSATHPTSATVSALSIKLASVTSEGRLPIPSGSAETSAIAISPPGEATKSQELVSQSSSVENTTAAGRPFGSDPVPIAAPAKAAVPTGYLIRSPPLEVVKEETAISVSSSEQQSPVDSSSIISNGRVEEENVAFLNQKFDDIPMIDDVRSSIETTTRKEVLNIKKGSKSSNMKVSNIIQPNSEASVACSKTVNHSAPSSAEVKVDMLVSKQPTPLLQTTGSASCNKSLQQGLHCPQEMSSCKTLQALHSNVPQGLQVKSSVSESSNRVQHPGLCDTSKRNSVSSASNVTCVPAETGCSEAAKVTVVDPSGTSSTKSQEKLRNASTSASGRQRKLATAAPPNAASLQEQAMPSQTRSQSVSNTNKNCSVKR